MYKFQNDKYQKARGGHSRILDVRCEKCDTHLAYYQKDGPGMLKRMYADRFIDLTPEGHGLVCTNCGQVLGNYIIYKKEDRPAYRLYAGSITKKVVSRDRLAQ